MEAVAVSAWLLALALATSLKADALLMAIFYIDGCNNPSLIIFSRCIILYTSSARFQLALATCLDWVLARR
jgi:hypothetical protein